MATFSYISQILLIITTFTTQHNAQNTTTPALTVAPIVVGFLETAMGNRLNLTAEYCLWNVSYMIHLINETDPDFLYAPSSKTLLLDSGYLPDYIIQQLPPGLLSFYGLNLTNQTQECSSSNFNQTDTSLDFCIGPLIHSELKNPINEKKRVGTLSLKNITGLDIYINVSLADCGLACSTASEFYGLTEQEQNFIDLFKVIGCTLCMVAMIFLITNHFWGQKRTDKKFQDKPLLKTIPYLITLCLFSIVLLMTIGEVVGKEAIVCSHFRAESEYTWYNPIYGKNAVCTVHGLFFYSSLVAVQCYVVLLSFVLFRQLYAPFRPLWEIKSKYWHVGVVAFVLVLDALALATSSFSGLYPMGVCFPSSNTETLFWFVVVPFCTSCTFSFLFLCGAICLLKKELSEQSKVSDSTARIQDLLHRLIYYAIIIVICLLLLCWTAIMFYVKISSDVYREALRQTFQCEISQLLLNPELVCPERTQKASPFWFYSWIMSAILAVGAQIILSCHRDARNRLKRTVTTVTSQFSMDSKSAETSGTTKMKSKSSTPDIHVDNGADIFPGHSPPCSPSNKQNNSNGGIALMTLPSVSQDTVKLTMTN